MVGGYEGIQDALLQTKQTDSFKVLQAGQLQNEELNLIDRTCISTIVHWDEEFFDSQWENLVENTKVSSKLLDYLCRYEVISTADKEHVESVNFILFLKYLF